MVGNAETLRTQRNEQERNPFMVSASLPFQTQGMGEPTSNATAVVAASRMVI